jgi:hypothetical protein
MLQDATAEQVYSKSLNLHTFDSASLKDGYYSLR